jgi:hypothetical protein
MDFEISTSEIPTRYSRIPLVDVCWSLAASDNFNLCGKWMTTRSLVFQGACYPTDAIADTQICVQLQVELFSKISPPCSEPMRRDEQI